MQRLRLFLIALVALLLACVPVKATAQFVSTPRHIVVENVSGIPKKTIFYEPPVIYEKWWKEVQECTGLKTPLSVFKKLKFRMVVADAFIADNDSTFLFAGLTMPWTNTITVTIEGVTKERLIKHEMTHVQMYHNGIQAGHPDIYFKKCKLVDGS